MDREELNELRRRVEEDYKLDIAAIERLQRRYADVLPPMSSNTPSSSVPLRANLSAKEWSDFESGIERPGSALPPSASSERKTDDLDGSIRTMFSMGRK